MWKLKGWAGTLFSGKHILWNLFTCCFRKTSRHFWKSLWWVEENSLKGFARLGERTDTLWRTEKDALANSLVRFGAWRSPSRRMKLTQKTCKTSLHKCHGGITCWFIIPSGETWAHSPRFTGFTSNQSTKIRASCEACETSVKAWRFT